MFRRKTDKEFLYILLSMLDKSQPVHLVVDVDNSAEQAEILSLSTDEMTKSKLREARESKRDIFKIEKL